VPAGQSTPQFAVNSAAAVTHAAESARGRVGATGAVVAEEQLAGGRLRT
jgi:hypothetical protein